MPSGQSSGQAATASSARIAAGGRADTGGPQQAGASQRERRWKRRTLSGKKTTEISTGQTTAIRTACVAIQEPPAAPTLPNSSRAAPTVEESGFHSATTPSQSGISDGATNALVIMVIGKSRPQTAPAASGLPTISPSQMPIHRHAKRSSSSSATASARGRAARRARTSRRRARRRS